MRKDGCSWEEIHAALASRGKRDNPGALFDEIQRIGLLKPTALNVQRKRFSLGTLQYNNFDLVIA